MGIQFGVGTLTILENRPLDVVIGDLSGSAGGSFTAGANRSVIIDGVTAILSAQVVQFTSFMNSTGQGHTGTGLMLFAYIPAGNTITAAFGAVTATDPINTSIGIQTAIAPIAKFSWGTAANAMTTFALISGGSATKTIARVQNVSINTTVESTQMRGGADIFPVDTQFFDGKVEGSFEFSNQTATQLLMFGGSYASAGASSGTWTLTALSKPEPVSLVFQNVTNGVTGTYRIYKAFLNQFSNDFGRTDYMNPSYNFMTMTNYQNKVMDITQ